jgi:hypothetical protein
MSRNILSGRLLGIFQVLSSAIEAAGAADAGRAARPRALRPELSSRRVQFRRNAR